MISAIEAAICPFYCFGISHVSTRGLDRVRTLNLFAKFVESCLAEGQSDIALKAVEDLLYSHYLKKLETEADYHQFFDKISEPYSKVENVSKMPSVSLSDGYLFVLHTPVMLAHINPLHRMLDLNGEKNNLKKM